MRWLGILGMIEVTAGRRMERPVDRTGGKAGRAGFLGRLREVFWIGGFGHSRNRYLPERRLWLYGLF